MVYESHWAGMGAYLGTYAWWASMESGKIKRMQVVGASGKGSQQGGRHVMFPPDGYCVSRRI